MKNPATGTAVVKAEAKEPVVAPRPLLSFWNDPVTFMRHFEDEMDRLFTNVGWPRFRRTLTPEGLVEMTKGIWAPMIELLEKDGKLLVRAELPGIKKEDVKIEILDNVLRIKGERKYEHEEKTDKVHRSEFSYGTFMRNVMLPEAVDAATAVAKFHEGLLEITLEMPKREEPKPLEVKIIEPKK